MSFNIIVARYNEDVDWTNALPNVLIINKGEELIGYQQYKMANVGREAHSYYQYIFQNYECLPDYLIFLQGDPFPHSPNLIANLNKFINDEKSRQDFEYLSEGIHNSTLSLESTRFSRCKKIHKYWKQVFGNDPSPNQECIFGAGAQFIVSKNRILRNSRSFYENICIMLEYSINPIEGYSIERFHKYIFEGYNNGNAITETYRLTTEDRNQSINNQSFESEMKRIGNKYQTDKIIYHHYETIYSLYLERLKGKTGSMIEIGVQNGNSIPLWNNLFPNLYVYGLDIKKNIEELNKDKVNLRYSIIQGDQSSKEDLNKLLLYVDEPCFFINDDGSHVPEHQLLTFNALFPKLEVGGVYIIEDIETSYWKRGDLYDYPMNYGYKNPNSIIEIFKNAVDGINALYMGGEEDIICSVQHLRYIHSITFAQNCIVIIKRDYNDASGYRFMDNV